MTDRQRSTVRSSVLQALESLEAAGVQQIAKPSRGELAGILGEASAQTQAADSGSRPAEGSASVAAANKSENLLSMDESIGEEISSAATLDILREEVAQCSLCEELAGTRTQTVFGVGSPQAKLCFLGEAPGADEDRQGEPFVGRAGKLLNKILEACGLSREEVYILNVLKCRPPENRNPTPEESQNCRRFLDRQLQLLNPEFICCLGAVAAQNLLSTTMAIGRLRGSIHEYRGIKVVCTYHPAYLLRNPSAKAHTWDDMKLLMREMGMPVD